MSLPIHLTFKYYKDMMVYKVLLDQLVYLEKMITFVNLTVKGIRDTRTTRTSGTKKWKCGLY